MILLISLPVLSYCYVMLYLEPYSIFCMFCLQTIMYRRLTTGAGAGKDGEGSKQGMTFYPILSYPILSHTSTKQYQVNEKKRVRYSNFKPFC